MPQGLLLAVDRNKDDLFDVDDVTKVKLDGTRIVAIGKTLDDWDGGDTGVMYCTTGLFDALREAAASGRYGLSDGLTVLAGRGRAHVADVSGAWWLDVDTPEAMRLAVERVAAWRDRSG